MLKVNEPAWLAVPLSAPLELSVKPLGNEDPDATPHV